MTHSTSKLSFLRPYVFITCFFLLKGEDKYKRNHRTTASEYFFPSCHPEWNTNCGRCCICWYSIRVFGCTDSAGQAFTWNYFCALPCCFTPFGLKCFPEYFEKLLTVKAFVIYASVISMIHMGVSEVRLKVLISSRVTLVSGCSIRSTQRAVAWANVIALVGPGPQTFPSRAFTLASSGVITLSNNHTSSLIPQLCHGARESHGTVCSAETQQAYDDFCPSTHHSLYICKMC